MLSMRLQQSQSILVERARRWSTRVRTSVLVGVACLWLAPWVTAQAKDETLRLFWSTTGLVDPANNNGFSNFPALGANPVLPEALGSTRLYLWGQFEGGGVQNWHILTFDVGLVGNSTSAITASDFWSPDHDGRTALGRS